MLLFTKVSFGQEVITKKIEVGYDKTTFIVFGSDLDFYDVGSEDLLFQKTNKPNIVKVKAAVESFRETNLTIITKDGQYYSFIVAYNADPQTLNYILTNGKPLVQTETIKQEVKQEEIIDKAKDDAQYVLQNLGNAPYTNTKAAYDYKIGFALSGVYVYKGKIYLNLKIENNGPIDYNVGALMFSVRQKKKRREATTAQDIQLQPIVTRGTTELVRAGQKSASILFAFDTFTINERQKLSIDLIEKGGSRNLTVELMSKDLLKAVIIR